MLSMDEAAAASRLAKVNPKPKLLFGFIAATLPLLANTLVSSVLLLMIMGRLTLYSVRLSAGAYLRLLSLPLGFIAMAVIPLMLQAHPANAQLIVGWRVFGTFIGISSEAFADGLSIALRSLAAISGMYFIILTTPMPDLLWALREFRLPTLLISLMELMHRYIFVFWSELKTMKTAQISRLGYVSFNRSVYSAGQLIASLFLRVYIKCDRVYAALESRGYNGEFYQLEKSYDCGRELIWGAAAIILLTGVTVWLERSVSIWV